ncbi:SIS domain-containing protein, partial [Bacillus licheniformis]
NAGDNDVLCAISHSGETQAIANAVRLAKKHGIKIIGLTRLGQSAVASLSDIALYTSCSNEATFRSADTSS